VIDHYPQEVKRFQASVDAHLDSVAATEPVIAAPGLEMDEQLTGRLRDLGYID
jgi:hypothetical protein